MRKKWLLIVAICLSVFLCGFVYANGRGISWKEFYNSLGEVIYYPVFEDSTTGGTRVNLLKQRNHNTVAPEAAEIGDIFLGEGGYEHVIAVSDDGAFVTESIP